MIIINGRVFSGNNVTIINGRVINGDEAGKSKQFDEWKVVNCSDVNKITIDSTVCDVNVSATNSSKAEVHFYGGAIVDEDVNFDVSIVNRELRITLLFTGNCYNENLRLDVTIPTRTFKVITARSSSADITLNSGVSAEYLKVKTLSGDLETDATVSNVSVSTTSGDIDLYIDAIQDVSVEASTTIGDVSAEFNNIGHINPSLRSMCGDVRNRHRGNRGFTADVDISTMSGDIKIR